MDVLNNESEQVKPQEQAQVRPCPHDCGKCSPWQQMYCCTKMVFDLSKSLQEIREEIVQLKAELNDVKGYMPAKIDEFINPE